MHDRARRTIAPAASWKHTSRHVCLRHTLRRRRELGVQERVRSFLQIIKIICNAPRELLVACSQFDSADGVRRSLEAETNGGAKGVIERTLYCGALGSRDIKDATHHGFRRLLKSSHEGFLRL